MDSDPIVGEIRAIRERIAARFNYDIDAIVDDAQQPRSYLRLGDHTPSAAPPRRLAGTGR